MYEDVVPEIINQVLNSHSDLIKNNDKLNEILELLKQKKATYRDAYEFSVEIGKAMSKSLNMVIKPEILPDGRLYFNIADRVLNAALNKNYELMTDMIKLVQTEVNNQAKIGVAPQIPEFDEKLASDMIDEIANEVEFEKIKALLDAPVVYFTQRIVDHAIEKNAKFQSDAGIPSVIIRECERKPCEWCANLAGTYDYPNGTPRNVFKRHKRCRCVTEYFPDKKRAQNVWTKEWRTV